MKGMDLATIIENVKKLDSSATTIFPQNSLAEVQFTPASLKNIIPHGIYYLVNSSQLVREFQESVIITDAEFETKNSAIIIVSNPQLVHYQLCAYFKPAQKHTIHPTAIIDPEAELGTNVHIGAYTVIGKCKIGDNTQIMHHVVIEDNVILENDVFIDSNSVIGAAGMAWIWDDTGTRILQPQLRGVVIEEFVRIATDVTIVRGSLSENTRIGAHTVIAHGSKIGHGAQLHENVHLANNVSLAGNAVIEARAFLGSAAVVSSNIKVAKNNIVGAGAVVVKTYDEENITIGGVPAKIIAKNNNQKKEGVPAPAKK